MEKCPECGKKYSKYPLFKIVNGKKKPIIRNWLIPDMFTVIMLIAIFSSFYGLYTIYDDCKICLYEPNKYCAEQSSLFYRNIAIINNRTEYFENQYNGFLPYDHNLKPFFKWGMIVIIAIGTLNLILLVWENRNKIKME